MKTKLYALLSSVVLVCAPSVRALHIPQQAYTYPSGRNLMMQSLTALTGAANLSDITLSGNVRRNAGADDEVGSVVLKATREGQSRVDYSFASGDTNEVRTSDKNGPLGEWRGPDGAHHSMVSHNLLTDSTWFSATLTLARLLGSKTIVSTQMGEETGQCGKVEHLRIAQQFSFAPSPEKKKLEELAAMDFFLDSDTMLPTCLAFKTHPDDDANTDIEVKIRFSDYRAIEGVQVPFHIQKYLNNSLHLDFVITSARLNSGVAASDFKVSSTQGDFK